MANETSVDALLQAAQFLEAASDDDPQRKRQNLKRQAQNYGNSRSTHNALEKNRRAQLRDCLELLRENVPFSDKMTTLSLLQSARRYIVILKRQSQEQDLCKRQLIEQNEELVHRLLELGAPVNVAPPAQHAQSGAAGEPVEEVCVESTEEGTGTDMPQPKRTHLLEAECETEVIIDVDSNNSDLEDSSSCSGSDGGISSTTIKWPVQEVVVTTSETSDGAVLDVGS